MGRQLKVPTDQTYGACRLNRGNLMARLDSETEGGVRAGIRLAGEEAIEDLLEERLGAVGAQEERHGRAQLAVVG
jgi:hypothetical protein